MNIFLTMIEAGLRELADYLQAHVITCLIPAFFIAGAIAIFISKQAVLKYFGSRAKKKSCILCSSSIRLYPGGMFLHSHSPLCRDLQERRRDRTCNCILIFGSCHQHPRHCLHGAGTRLFHWNRQSRDGHYDGRGHRAGHGFPVWSG